MNKFFLLFFVAFALLPLSVMAASSEAPQLTAAREVSFHARLSLLQCKVDLTTRQIDALAAVGNTSASSFKQTLSGDLQTLSSLISPSANKSIAKEFDAYLNSTFRDHLAQAVSAVKAGVKKVGQNPFGNSKQALRSSLKAAQGAFAECASSRESTLVTSKIGYYRSWIGNANATIQEMYEKGFGTSQMQSVVDALEQKVSLLSAALDSGNAAKIAAANEDARNQLLHSWANFEIVRIESHFSKLAPEAAKYGLDSKLAEITTKLGDARSLATSGKKYGAGEFEKVWQDLSDAAKGLRELAQQLRKARGN